MEPLSLAGGFPPASEADWHALVERSLDGASYETLRTALLEGFKTGPLYTKAGAAPPLPLPRGWFVVQPLCGRMLHEARALIADDPLNGIDALFIDFDAELGVHGPLELRQLLGSDMSYFLAPTASVADAALVLAAARRSGEQFAIGGSAGFDPLGVYALSGELPADRSLLFADFVDAALFLRQHAPRFVPFLACGRAWNDAGASAVQELAFTLAAGVAYWRALAEAGLSVSDAASCIGFSLTASADIFLTIATFRAMRLLWAKALDAVEETLPQDFLLLGTMSRRILTTYDPHVNLLRGTAAAFGAAIGGASGVAVLPFDSAAGEPSCFSQRLARNTSLILRHESYLGAVADAAAGSAYVEALTDEIAASAWALFREVEAQGGLASALEAGFVQREIARIAGARERAIALGDIKITGVSAFPNLSEGLPPPSVATASKRDRPATELALPQAGKGERFAALVESAQGGTALGGLRAAARRVASFSASPLAAPKRDAEGFETLRRRADLALMRIGARPPIFLAILGRPEDYRDRAQWVRGFFASGGFDVIEPENGFESVETLVAAFKDSPAPVACLCSSNRVYGAMAGAAAALKKAGAAIVYFAGTGSAATALNALDQVAIDRVIHRGCNALILLREAQDILRVEELSEAVDREAREGIFETYPTAGMHSG